MRAPLSLPIGLLVTILLSLSCYGAQSCPGTGNGYGSGSDIPQNPVSTLRLIVALPPSRSLRTLEEAADNELAHIQEHRIGFQKGEQQ
jgi:hypothetical protein